MCRKRFAQESHDLPTGACPVHVNSAQSRSLSHLEHQTFSLYEFFALRVFSLYELYSMLRPDHALAKANAGRRLSRFLGCFLPFSVASRSSTVALARNARQFA
jgi:hypothetical protein